MPYKLKKNGPEFDCVDGPFAGKKFRHGETYRDIPQNEKSRFESVKTEAPKVVKTSTAPAKKNDVSEDDKKASVKAPTKGGSNK